MTDVDRRALRAELRARRRALDPRQRMRAGHRVAEHLVPLIGPGYVAGYWACDGELPLHALLPHSDHFVYCLPKLRPGKQLAFAPWRPGDPLQANRYGIPEPDFADSSLLAPEQLNYVLLPLLGFARDGARLGSGGGFYDRSFAFRRQHPELTPRLIGVGYACQELESLPLEAWDVPLDLVVTEAGVIDCAQIRSRSL